VTQPNRAVADSLQREFRMVTDESLRSAVNFRRSSEDAFHRWFRYREGFSPDILSIAASSKQIFDPFCGCGTTLLEAQRRGISAVGVDVNPLAVFVAKVKTEYYSQRDRDRFVRAFHEIPSVGSAPWQLPAMPLLPKLFQPAALRELAKIRGAIEHETSPKIRNLLHLCWLNILERCSNVFKEGNGLKYRNKRRRPGEYETIPDSIWVPAYFGRSIRDFVKTEWLRQCEMVASDLEGATFRAVNRPEVVEKSCLDADLVEAVGSCDAAVFSPPYANRFDYFEAFKIELWMGGFVRTSDDLRRLRQRSVRNNLTVSDGEFAKTPDLESILRLMDETASSVRMGIRNTLRGYFDDIRQLAANLYELIRKRGTLACVIGNSAYAGVLIPTDLLSAAIFRDAGFHVKEIRVARHLHVSSQQRLTMDATLHRYMRESVIICTR
jgi:site-specific DNA-methyltransferase (adenine-specific)